MNFWTFLDRNISGIGWFLVFTMLLGATVWGVRGFANLKQNGSVPAYVDGGAP